MECSSIGRAREEAARFEDKNEQKGEVTNEKLPLGIDSRARRLRDAENYAARQRSPEAAEAADNDGLEGEDQSAWTDRRIEIGPKTHEKGGDGANDHRDAHRNREHLAVVDAHQLRGDRIVRNRAKSPAQRRSIKYLVHRDDDADGGEKRQERQHADCQAANDGDRQSLDAARRQASTVRGEASQHPILEKDRQSEARQQRRQNILAKHAIEEKPLQ